jgi:hypothetical protein
MTHSQHPAMDDDTDAGAYDGEMGAGAYDSAGAAARNVCTVTFSVVVGELGIAWQLLSVAGSEKIRLIVCRNVPRNPLLAQTAASRSVGLLSICMRDDTTMASWITKPFTGLMMVPDNIQLVSTACWTPVSDVSVEGQSEHEDDMLFFPVLIQGSMLEDIKKYYAPGTIVTMSVASAGENANDIIIIGPTGLNMRVPLIGDTVGNEVGATGRSTIDDIVAYVTANIPVLPLFTMTQNREMQYHTVLPPKTMLDVLSGKKVVGSMTFALADFVNNCKTATRALFIDHEPQPGEPSVQIFKCCDVAVHNNRPVRTANFVQNSTSLPWTTGEPPAKRRMPDFQPLLQRQLVESCRQGRVVPMRLNSTVEFVPVSALNMAVQSLRDVTPALSANDVRFTMCMPQMFADDGRMKDSLVEAMALVFETQTTTSIRFIGCVVCEAKLSKQALQAEQMTAPTANVLVAMLLKVMPHLDDAYVGAPPPRAAVPPPQRAAVPPPRDGPVFAPRAAAAPPRDAAAPPRAAAAPPRATAAPPRATAAPQRATTDACNSAAEPHRDGGRAKPATGVRADASTPAQDQEEEASIF